MATEVSAPRSPVAAFLVQARVRAPRWTAAAWGAIAVTTLFVAITCWWLSQDHSIPTFDAGFHLIYLQAVYHELSAGHLIKAFTVSERYPPLAYLIGSLGLAIGGVGVTPPIIAENLVFVPLLALGCYQVGKRAFGPTAGLLAVVFALGSPLATAQFHVFMVDAPETAMVAVSIWLIIATENFSRVGMSALAGLAVGLGMLTKEPLVFFVAGVLGVSFVRLILAMLREGWQKWHGLAAFVVVALVVALPWYIGQYSIVHTTASYSIIAANHPQ
jgi:4-amino-4-deoxy-L-arabinose transferase-like glycosyltransferase